MTRSIVSREEEGKTNVTFVEDSYHMIYMHGLYNEPCENCASRSNTITQFLSKAASLLQVVVHAAKNKGLLYKASGRERQHSAKFFP